jgi:hypothetical protein
MFGALYSEHSVYSRFQPAARAMEIRKPTVRGNLKFKICASLIINIFPSSEVKLEFQTLGATFRKCSSLGLDVNVCAGGNS